MSYFKVFSFVFAIVIGYFVIKVSSLQLEAIINGHPAEQRYFKYQAAILGKQNYSNQNLFICGGVIVHDYFVLSSAHCFIDFENNLKQLRYSVIVGARNLQDAQGTIIDVSIIYTLLHDPITLINDIAVVRLYRSLNLVNNPNLSALRIPSPDDKFMEKVGLVSGYGFIQVTSLINLHTRTAVRYSGTTNFSLNYGHVVIVNIQACKYAYSNISNWGHYCGVMLTDRPGQAAGICSYDEGSPLVIENNIVGIASRNTANCDDTQIGAIYTKVSAFQHFIRVMLTGSYLTTMNTYFNYRHIR